jgi:DNA-binding response OmpR family regulator
MSQTTVLFIAEASQIYSDLKHLFAQDGILVCQADHWKGNMSFSETAPPHLIILDCPGSGVDGLAVCQAIRARYSGLLVIVAESGEERFHMLALDLGADASFSKTISAPLIVANIKAMLRRFASTIQPSVLNFGKLTVDANQREVFVAGQAAQLSTFEFQLIWYLAQHSGCVVARDEIYRELRNSTYNGYDRSIDVYVSRIRQKIGDDSTSPKFLKTVRGVGYQFVCVEN